MSGLYYLTFSLLFLLGIGLRSEDVSKKKEQKEITLRIAFPKDEKLNLITSYCQDLSNDLRVIIKNNTDTVATFYNDNNFLGMYNISFEVRTTDTVYYLKRIGGNMDSHQRHPYYTVLLPGDSLVFETNLQPCNCDSMPVQANPTFYPLHVCFTNIPEHSLPRAKLKAIYQLGYEAHQDLLEHPVAFQSFLGNKGRAAKLTTAQIIKSFVADKLESQEYDIQFETDVNQ